MDRARRGVVAFTVVAAVIAAAVGPGPKAAAAVLDRGPFPSAFVFIHQQFPDFLDREARSDEAPTWMAKVNAGQAAGTTVDGIRQLPGGLDQFGPVARLYSAYLLRIPDAGGLTYWLGKYRSGRTLSWISSSFASSREFKNRYGSLTNRGFVLLIYRNVLQRNPDTAGVDYWTRKLNAGTSRGQVMLNFSESSEYKRKTGAAVDTLQAYLGLLRRAPNPTENTAGIALVKASGFAALAGQLLVADEYRRRFGFTSTNVNVDGSLYGEAPVGQTVVSPDGAYAYATNPARNRVEVLDIAKRKLIAPIAVGAEPFGVDLSPDGTKLYVANSGGQDISIVDVASRSELRRVTIPPKGSGVDRPMSVAVGSHGTALIGTTHSGIGFGGRILQMDLTTEAITETRIGINNSSTTYTPMRASGDRSKIYLALGKSSSGQAYVYDAATKTTTQAALGATLEGVAINEDGSVAVFNGRMVTGLILALRGWIPDTYRSNGAVMALTPTGNVGYRAEGTPSSPNSPGVVRSIDVANLELGPELMLTDTITPSQGAGLVALVPGQDLAIVQTDHGLCITRLPAVP